MTYNSLEPPLGYPKELDMDTSAVRTNTVVLNKFSERLAEKRQREKKLPVLFLPVYVAEHHLVLGPTSAKLTAKCFVGARWEMVYADAALNSLPAEQPEMPACRIATAAFKQNWAIGSGLPHILRTNTPETLDSLDTSACANALLERRYTATLPQIEELVALVERGWMSAVLAGGSGIVFFVKTNNPSRPVLACYLRRADRRWYVRFYQLDDPTVFDASTCIIVPNLDFAGLL